MSVGNRALGALRLSETSRGHLSLASIDQLSADLAQVGVGDSEALRRVYLAYGKQLFALCLHVTGDRSAAEDVLQEAMLKIWNRAAAFDPARNSAKAWLATIVRNSAIDWCRTRNRRHFVSDDEISMLPDEAEPALERIIRRERENHALELLAKLPDEHENELRSIFMQGLTYPELAALEGMPLATVKSRVRRALIALRKKFADE